MPEFKLQHSKHLSVILILGLAMTGTLPVSAREYLAPYGYIERSAFANAVTNINSKQELFDRLLDVCRGYIDDENARKQSKFSCVYAALIISEIYELQNKKQQASLCRDTVRTLLVDDSEHAEKAVEKLKIFMYLSQAEKKAGKHERAKLDQDHAFRALEAIEDPAQQDSLAFSLSILQGTDVFVIEPIVSLLLHIMPAEFADSIIDAMLYIQEQKYTDALRTVMRIRNIRIETPNTIFNPTQAVGVAIISYVLAKDIRMDSLFASYDFMSEKTRVSAYNRILPTIKPGETGRFLLDFIRDADGKITAPVISNSPFIVTDITQDVSHMLLYTQTETLATKINKTPGDRQKTIREIFDYVYGYLCGLSILISRDIDTIEVIDMQLVPLKTEYRGSRIQQSKDWKYIPGKLRTMFESGGVLITEEPNRHNMQQAEYFVLFPVRYRGVTNETKNTIEKIEPYYGRSGLLLMKLPGGRLTPVIADIDGKDFLLRIKGHGTPTGGFGRWILIAGENRLRGAVEKQEAEFEFMSLELRRQHSRFKKGLTPRAAGNIFFKGSIVEQALHLAWTPTDSRAHWQMNAGYNIRKDRNTPALMREFGREFGDLLSMDIPLLPWRSATADNIVSAGADRWSFTDHASILPLYMEGISQYHEWANGQLMLGFTAGGHETIYNKKLKKYFLEGMCEVLLDRNKITPEDRDYLVSRDMFQVVLSFLQRKFLYEQIFKNRLSLGYYPHEYITHMTKLINHLKDIESLDEFVAIAFHEEWSHLQACMTNRPQDPMWNDKQLLMRKIVKNSMGLFLINERDWLYTFADYGSRRLEGARKANVILELKNRALRETAKKMLKNFPPYNKFINITDDEADGIVRDPEKGIVRVIKRYLNYPDISYPETGRTRPVSQHPNRKEHSDIVRSK